MSAVPNFATTPVVGAALLTAGDTSRTAPGSGGQAIFTPGATGGLCERINIVPVATTVVSVIRIWRYDGTTAHLYKEFGLPAQTLAAGVAVADQVISAVSNPELFPIEVPPNWSVRVTVNDAQTGVKVQGSGGSF